VFKLCSNFQLNNSDKPDDIGPNIIVTEVFVGRVTHQEVCTPQNSLCPHKNNRIAVAAYSWPYRVPRPTAQGGKKTEDEEGRNKKSGESLTRLRWFDTKSPGVQLPFLCPVRFASRFDQGSAPDYSFSFEFNRGGVGVMSGHLVLLLFHEFMR
jgi:hypothetical protein